MPRTRSFLALGCALTAALAAGCPGGGSSPQPATEPATAAPAAGDAIDRAEATLERLVRARCQDPAEPWALVHGVIALGPKLQVNGRDAVDLLVEQNCEHGDHGPGFPARRGPVLVEPHPAYFVKNFLELGLDPARTFAAPGGKQVRLDALARAAATAYAPAEQRVRFMNEAWRLEAVAATAERDAALAPRAAALRDEALAVLAENQRYFEAWLGDRTRPYDKATEAGPAGKPAPAAIHRYFCGGFHFFQAVQRLHGKTCPPGLARQYDLLRVRLEVEARYWDGKLAQALRTEGDQRRRHVEVILSQSLKVLGHGLETWYRAVADGALVPDAAARGDIEAAAERLATVVGLLEAQGVLADLDGVRARAPQIYLDLVGDGAHALHALRLRRELASRR